MICNAAVGVLFLTGAKPSLASKGQRESRNPFAALKGFALHLYRADGVDGPQEMERN